MTANLDDDLVFVKGSALAAFGLTVNTLRFLRDKGTLEQEEVTRIVHSMLASFEQSDLVSDPVAHAVRTVLSGIAGQLGVPLKPPN
jgi:hypothetical protein